ncbi:MAG: hypothetical protein QM638_16585 [Nocardioides sp.]
MKDSTVANGLELHWVTIRDAQGHEHLEARWVDRQVAAVAAPDAA